MHGGKRRRQNGYKRRRRDKERVDPRTTNKEDRAFIVDDSYERLACDDNTARRSKERIPFSLFYRTLLVRQWRRWLLPRR